jgi:large subunit ribosomal protein L5
MKGLVGQYKKELRAKIQKELGLSNVMSVPRVEKIVLNIGLGRARQNKEWLDIGQSILTRITGQRPIMIKARKSISNFKIRQGMVVGAKVTLRGARMYDFLEKLINITFPRLRDFHGLDPKKGFDGHGNYILGVKEHIVFPEIGMEDVDKIHGLEVCITTTAKDDNQARSLLGNLGFPFKKSKKQ